MMALFYKDFKTGHRRWTRGEPVRIMRGGPLNCWYLVIKRRASELFIPEYCLVGASRAHFNIFKAREEGG